MIFTKEQYWENRKAGKRGQGDIPKPKITDPEDMRITFDNNGNMVVINRAYRRQHTKLPNSQPKKNKRKK